MPGHRILLSLLAALGLLQGAPSDADAQRALARQALERGDPASALEAALLGLEFAPEDAGLLELASRAAEAAERDDQTLWLAALARDRASALGDLKLLAQLEARIAALDPTEEKALLQETLFFTELSEIAKGAERRKLYLNAADLHTRCARGPLADKARAELDKLYANKRALDALLSAGVDVPIRTSSKRSADWIAREDARRSAWDKAHELKGDNYTLVTNMGYEMAEAMLVALEQMNRFYRRVFQHKERGGNTARCTIHVYKSRAEFDLHEGQKPPSMGGFYVSGENRVATFDPRTAQPPRSIDELWSTLFHEASHQFTAMVAKSPLPAWLNEGTASYFEGARILPNGAVETNLVPEDRLASLVQLLADGGPTLQEVIAFAGPGSYEAEHYPFGWGLVYFLHNYENEDCERVYLPLYKGLLGTYGSGGRSDDAFARFVELFITAPKLPGVESFEQFEQRWRAWIAELWTLHSGGAEKADELLARGRKQAALGKHEAARDSLRWALRKRPGDPAVHLELARTHEALGEVDAALVAYRRAREAVLPLEPAADVAGSGGLDAAAFAATCVARETKLDRQLAERLEALRQSYSERCAAGARAYAVAGLSRVALLVLDRAVATLGPDRGWNALRKEIESAHGRHTGGIWRRLPLDAGSGLWQLQPGWRKDGTALVGSSEASSFALWSGSLPERLVFEVRMRPGEFGEWSACGIVFATGGGSEGMDMIVLDARGVLETMRFSARAGFHTRASLHQVNPGEEVLLSVERAGAEVRLSVNGKLVRTRKHERGVYAGDVGLWVREMDATFDLPRLCY